MKQEFDGYAGEYSKLLRDPLRDNFADKSFFHERKLQLLRQFMRDRGLNAKQCSWVDIGCGQGDLLKLGVGDFGQASGCDVSTAMLDTCQGLEVRHQERNDVLPFPDRFADLATAVCVYHHVPPPGRAALTREARRILKPGGTFCIIEHNPLNPVTRIIVKRTPIDADAQLLGVSETCRLLAEQGLQIIGIEHFLFLPEFLFRKAGYLERWLKWVPFGGQYAVFASM